MPLTVQKKRQKVAFLLKKYKRKTTINAFKKKSDDNASIWQCKVINREHSVKREIKKSLLFRRITTHFKTRKHSAGQNVITSSGYVQGFPSLRNVYLLAARVNENPQIWLCQAMLVWLFDLLSKLPLLTIYS